MIVAEEGVTIEENGKKRGGTKDFLKAFNKYSDYDYQKKLREIIGNNSIKDTMEQLMGSLKDEERERIQLPKINQYATFKDQVQKIDVKQQATKDTLKLTSKNALSLKNALEILSAAEDKFDLMSQTDKEEKTHNTNIFKFDNIKEKIKEDLQKTQNFSINTFNQTLMTNSIDSRWGENNPNRKFNQTMDGRRVYKPDIKELELELGKNLVHHSKLPRARVRSEIKDPKIFLQQKQTGTGKVKLEKIKFK